MRFHGFPFEGHQESEGGSKIRDGMEVERVSPAARHGVFPMAKTVQKLTLSASRDIPFDRLVLSQSNVRRVKAGVSIEELAADIARRTLAAEPYRAPGAG